MTQPAPATLLNLSGVTCRFGGLIAVNDLNLLVAPGEVLGIIGPNGAGKSTLIQLVTGLIAPTTGSIEFAGTRLNGRKPDAIAALGIARTFQTSRIFPGLSIWDSAQIGTHLALLGGGAQGRRLDPASEIADAWFGLKGQRKRRADLAARTEQTLKLFGDRLWPRRHDVAATLSYANRRRLEIARAIVAEPQLLLLDEPMAGMNPTETGELADILAALHAARPTLAIVIVEHKMDVIRRLCHRVVVMSQGSVIVEGAPERVLEDPRVVEAYLGRRDSAKAAS